MSNQSRIAVVSSSICVILLAVWSASEGGTAQAVGVEPRPDSDHDYREITLERVIDAETLRKTGSKVLKWVTGRAGAEESGLVRPYGIAWRGEDLLVTDPGSGRVLRVGRRGKIQARSGKEITAPLGVASCSGGIVVTESESGRVALLDDRLRFEQWIAQDLERPTGVACDPGGIYVVETGRHRVVIFDPRGFERSPVVFGTRGTDVGEFNFPVAIATSGDAVWVGDTLNFRIQEFASQDARPVRSFGSLGDAPGEMPRIKGLAIDVLGHLWITDAHLDQIAIYAPRGRFLGHLGGSGIRPGEFSFPAGVAAHADGRVAVADSLNRRIQVFRVASSRSERSDR